MTRMNLEDVRRRLRRPRTVRVKGHVLYDAIYMNHLEQGNLYTK